MSSLISFDLELSENSSYSELSCFISITVILTPLSVIFASQRSLSPECALINFTNPAGTTVIIEPAFSLILVSNVIIILRSIFFSVFKYGSYLYISLSMLLNLYKHLYSSLNLLLHRNPYRNIDFYGRRFPILFKASHPSFTSFKGGYKGKEGK